MDRECNKCVYHTSGSCSAWECAGTKTVEDVRADAIEEYRGKIDYLKNCYVDACNMCTRMECDVCAISNFIEDLEQLKEQKNG